MDGLEVARQLRADRAFRDVLIIAVTGFASEEDRNRSREIGIDHHLVKPADRIAGGHAPCSGKSKEPEELHLRRGRVQGGLKQLKSKVGRRLRRLAYDDAMARRRDQIVENIQSSQGLSREEATRQLRDWELRRQADRRAERESHDRVG